MVMLYSLGEVLWSCYIHLVKLYGHVIFSWWSFMVMLYSLSEVLWSCYILLVKLY